MADDDSMDIWVLCKHPTDYPDKYTARRHVANAAGYGPTSDVIVDDNIDNLRVQMLERGLICIDRAAGDDPVIVESWL